jgi:tetratricopeptide (TPR) repeat protein
MMRAAPRRRQPHRAREAIPPGPILFYHLVVKMRSLLILAGAVLVVFGALMVFWPTERIEQPAPPGSPPALVDMRPLPLPPEMPRISEGLDYDRCLGLLRDDPEEAMRFAQAWDATGGGEGALHCAALAMIGLGEPERAAERLERLAAASHSGGLARASVYGQAAQAWMMAGDANRAFGAVTLALTLAPTDPDLMVDRAVVLAALRRYGDALEDLDRAIAAEPERIEAHVFRAAALRHLDRQSEALLAVERALSLSAENAEALLERGILRQMRGDIQGARADWERVVQLSPDSVAANLAQQNLALAELGPQRR